MSLPPQWTASSSLSPLGCSLTCYTSSKTGLRVVLITSEGPMVKCYFTLSTEATTNSYAHKDDGLPHTLEHLVFLGSTAYPYKGVLDKLANRCLAEGTNAWTAEDHTAYTVETAGGEGFVNILPVYADHIFFPTLTDEGFTTEIHHVDGEGEDKGVVYCEMQGRENSDGSLIDRKCMDLLYPDAECGYNSETGGKMSNIREGLTNDKIRRYHKEYYRPDNAVLIISGIVDAKAVLDGLEEFEEKWVKTHNTDHASAMTPPTPPPMPRPWVTTPVTPLTSSTSATITFPSEDESTGTVSVCWRGPSYTDPQQFETTLARDLLFRYLSDSPASPLQRAFVENEAAICGSLGPAAETLSTGYNQLWFSSCPIDSLPDIIPLLTKELARVAEEGVDMSLMATEIKRYKRSYKKEMENDPSGKLLWPVLKHFLYSDRDAGSDVEVRTLEAATDVLASLSKIETELFPTSEAWCELLRAAFVDAHKVHVTGVPSAKLARDMADAEAKRTKDQAAALGEERLRELGVELSEAGKANEIEAPDEILNMLPIPDSSNLPEIKVEVLHDDDDEGPVRGEGSDDLVAHLDRSKASSESNGNIPVSFVHLNTVFAKITAWCDTSAMPPALRHCLWLLFEVAFKLPVGDAMDSQAVIEALQDETVAYGLNGSGASSARGVEFFVQTEVEEIGTAAAWLRRIMFETEFEPAELKKAAGKLVKDIPDYKRSARSMGGALMTQLTYGDSGSETNYNSSNFFRQQTYLEKVLRSLEAGDGLAVEEMRECRRQLVKNVRIVVATNLLEVKDVYGVIGSIFEGSGHDDTNRTAGFRRSGAPVESLRDYNFNRFPSKTQVMGLSGAENSSVTMACRGIGAFDDDLPSLMCAIEYLIALEGEFWVKIRGSGLSYSYHLANSTNSKKLSFTLGRATDPVKALRAAGDIVGAFASGSMLVTKTGLDATKSSLISSIVSDTSTKNGAAAMAKFGLFSGKEYSAYSKSLIRKLLAVTAEETLRALKEYLVPLFEGASTTVAVVPLNKVDEIVAQWAGEDAEVVKEDELEKLYRPLCIGMERDLGVEAEAKRLKIQEGGGGSALALDWTNIRACECPKCDKPEK